MGECDVVIKRFERSEDYKGAIQIQSICISAVFIALDVLIFSSSTLLVLVALKLF